MIYFDNSKKQFTLTTENTKYVFHIENDKFLIHDFYGDINTPESDYFKSEYHSFTPYRQDARFVGWKPDYSLGESLLEFSFFDSGDFRPSSLKLKGKNGSSSTLFVYKNHEVLKDKPKISGIPIAKKYGKSESLAIYLYDEITDCDLTLYYNVYPEFDIITRHFSLKNNGEKSVKIEKAMSLCLDIKGCDFDLISLYGGHNNERNLQRAPLFNGNMSIASRRGASSHQHNPFIALAGKNTDEEKGEIYAFNLIYSGCFLDEIEVSEGEITRVGIGLGEENFAFTLEKAEEFYSPEAVMLYSKNGLGDMSRKMHSFVRSAIMPKEKSAKRPVVINTWEACYFDIDEQKLLEFAEKGVALGMDTLVMDDGWFGKRNDDKRALGDWYENKEKFPKGLKSFAERVKATGINFGIWIEPEMINPDSDLFRAHPDWCIEVKGREPSLSRNQLVIDMCNPEVVEYLKQSFKKTFKDVPIDYIKWDFNRHLSEVGSNYLPEDKQDEAHFRFYLGVYELYNWLISEYPNVFLENCSGGGGRYDLAMMSFSPQIWCSDNTNAVARNKIQYGTSLAYPSAEMSCHVSNPENGDDTLRSLKYKYDVALGGVLGYELNIVTAREDILEKIPEQIKFYRSVEDLVKHGDLYRLISPFQDKNETAAYYYTNSSADKILLSFLQSKGSTDSYTLKICVADENAGYRDSVTDTVYSGKALKNGFTVKGDGKDEFSKIICFTKE